MTDVIDGLARVRADVALALAAIEYHPSAGAPRLAEVDLLRYMEASPTRLVAVAGDHQYLDHAFTADAEPPALAFGVDTGGHVHSLVCVSTIDVPAGRASLDLRPVSDSEIPVDRAAAYLLGLEQLFAQAPVDRVHVSLLVRPEERRHSMRRREVDVAGLVRRVARGSAGVLDRLIVVVDRAVWDGTRLAEAGRDR